MPNLVGGKISNLLLQDSDTSRQSPCLHTAGSAEVSILTGGSDWRWDGIAAQAHSGHRMCAGGRGRVGLSPIVLGVSLRGTLDRFRPTA